MSTARPQALRAGRAARTSRRGKVELDEVEEAGEEAEEGLLDVVEGGAEGRPRWHPGQGHRGRASVSTSISWPGGGIDPANRRKFVGGQGAPQCRTERGSHAHDDLGQLPRPPAGTGGSYGAAQVSIGHMQAWGSKPVGVSREGAGAKHAEAGGACGLGRLRPVGGLGRVRVCAPARARRKRSGIVLISS